MKLLLLSGCLLGLNISTVWCQALSFDGILEMKPLKRGNAYQIMWTGGNEFDRIVLELVKDNQNFGTWEQGNNQGKSSIRLSHKLKPGDNYHFKISNKENNSTTVSNAIEIRRKIPLGIKLIGIAMVPVVVIILSTDKSDPVEAAKTPLTPPIPN